MLGVANDWLLHNRGSLPLEIYDVRILPAANNVDAGSSFSWIEKYATDLMKRVFPAFFSMKVDDGEFAKASSFNVRKMHHPSNIIV